MPLKVCVCVCVCVCVHVCVCQPQQWIAFVRNVNGLAVPRGLEGTNNWQFGRYSVWHVMQCLGLGWA